MVEYGVSSSPYSFSIKNKTNPSLVELTEIGKADESRVALSEVVVEIPV